MLRSGHILTTHRLMELTLANTKACCQMTFFCPSFRAFRVRSFFPTVVKSMAIADSDERACGRICYGRSRGIAAAYSTDKGALSFDFSFNAGGEAERKKKIAFIQAIALGTTAAHGEITDVESTGAADYSWGTTVPTLYPFCEQETILSQYKAVVPDPWCWFNAARPCHPAAPMCLTCGVMPFSSDGMATLTNKSVIIVKERGNRPFFCFASCFLSRNTTVFWTPINEFKGSSVATLLEGKETFWSRCFYGTTCGKYCCPKFKSVANIECLVEGHQNSISLLVGDLNATGSIRGDPKLKTFRQDTARVHKALNKDIYQNLQNAVVVSVVAQEPAGGVTEAQAVADK